MKAPRGILTFVGWCGLLLMAWGNPAEAATGDADGTYTVTVTKIEISSDGGSTFTTIFSGSTSINIASADAGAVAASLASGAALPPGTYNRVRTTIGDTMRIKGYVNDGATTYYTNNDADGFGLNLTAANTPGADYATSTLAIPAANRVSTETFSIIIPKGGSAPTVRIAFDTTGTLSIVGGLPTINAPIVTTTSA